MLIDDNERMREFMMVVAAYAEDGVAVPEVINEEAVAVNFRPAEHPIVADLRDLSFKMRAFCETQGGDYALGVETGMQRCADMIDNLIRRHTEGE